MRLFGRKKPEEKPAADIQDIQQIKNAVGEESLPIFTPGLPKEEPTVEKKEEEKKPEFAPLFVKINRYSSVLDLLNDLKSTVMMVKNAIVVEKEIERLSEENRKMIEEGVNKIEARLMQLDSEFLRPKGFKDEFKTPGANQGLDNVVDQLKSQVEDLKAELENIS